MSRDINLTFTLYITRKHSKTYCDNLKFEVSSRAESNSQYSSEFMWNTKAEFQMPKFP